MTNEEYQMRLVRHGEVLLIPISDLPNDVEEVYSGERYIVARSETHHHHTAVGDVTIYKPVGGDTADIYLRANKDSVIEHQKTFDRHETKTLNEGLYIVRGKTEYDPFTKMLERVRD